MDDIKPQMKMFADEWLTGAATGKKFNGVAAYRHAGYTVNEGQPSANPSKLLRHPKVQAYIKKRMEEVAMTADEVFFRFTDIARSEMGDVLTRGPHGRLEIDHKLLEERKHLIKSFGYDSNGNEKIEFHDSFEALKQCARILGMMKDGLEITGPGGGPAKMVVEFVDPDGKSMDLGPTNEAETEVEDFSEFDEG